MKNRWPRIVFFSGCGCLLLAVTVLNPGPPFLDPTPEMQLAELKQELVCKRVLMAGFALCAAGTLMIVVLETRGMLQRRPERRDSPKDIH